MRETVRLYIELLEKIVELGRLKLLLTLMNVFRTQCPQKLSVESSQGNILWKSCNSQTSALTDKCLKALRVDIAHLIGPLSCGQEWFFFWRIVVFLISDNWPSLCLEAAKRIISFRLPSANCEKWRGFCDGLGGYFIETRRANDSLHIRINTGDYLKILSH